ncbi:MAG: alginate lyase family protein [Candidatus Sumerlaeota bacterium]
MKFSRIFIMMLAILWLAAGVRAAEVGEFSIPDVRPLDESERGRLREFVQSDAEAKVIAEQVAEQAKPFIGAEARPVEVIHYEGLVNTNPKRVKTVENLSQMAEAGWLLRHWQLTGDEAAAETLREWIVTWTSTYKITGNDVNENKFYPLLVAYLALRDTMDGENVKQVDAWVERLGEAHEKHVKESTHFTNRYSKSVRLLAIAGMILDREEWVVEAHKGIRRFVRNNLYADGTSEDLKRRDSLTYHKSSLKPVVDLAIMTGGDEGRALYDWESERGGSIRKSVDYLVPYAMGEKTHEEWKDTKVDLDRRRAKAGLEKYRPGRLYEPKNAQDLMERAAYFDPELHKVVLHLTDSDAKHFPTFLSLLNAAKREE